MRLEGRQNSRRNRPLKRRDYYYGRKKAGKCTIELYISSELHCANPPCQEEEEERRKEKISI